MHIFNIAVLIESMYHESGAPFMFMGVNIEGEKDWLLYRDGWLLYKTYIASKPGLET